MDAEKILEVQDISVVLDNNQPVVIIKASGTVTSSGWKNSMLVPHNFDSPPPDGIYDFDFVAEPPKDISIPVLMPIGATLKLESIPENFKGIRIHGGNSNYKEKIMTEQILEPNSFELHNQDTQITYSTTSFIGKPQLYYKTQKIEKQFTGEEISVLETEIGKLITVMIERTHPDVRGNVVKLTLLLPTVNLPASLENPIQTEAVLTTELVKGNIDRPLEGQIQIYKIFSLTGTARRVDF